MGDLMERGLSWGAKHYFYGGSPAVVEELSAATVARFPGLRIVGSESPPFRTLTAGEMAAAVTRIRTSDAHFVWVGLGTPKQDFFVSQVSRQLLSVQVGVGAAFDFMAGAKREAPSWLQGYGLEWTFRLANEPRRLWRRYFIGGSRFVAAVIRDDMRSWRFARR